MAERSADLSGRSTTTNGSDDYSPAQHLVNVRQMHLKTVLLFVYTLRHPFESPGLVQLCGSGAVDCEITNRCSIVRTPGERRLGKVVMVRRPKEEYSLTVDIST